MNIEAPFIPNRDGIYTNGQIILALGISENALRLERKTGRLRFVRISGFVLYRGEWIFDWMEDLSDHIEAKGDFGRKVSQ